MNLALFDPNGLAVEVSHNVLRPRGDPIRSYCDRQGSGRQFIQELRLDFLRAPGAFGVFRCRGTNRT